MSLRACILASRRVGQRLARAGVKVEVIEQHPARFLAAVARRSPAVALIDVPLKADRLGVVETLAHAYPSLRTVVALPRRGDHLSRRYRAAGAFACVKQGKTPELVRVLGEAYRATPLPDAPQLEALTPREREVLRHVGSGLDNLKIGALLGITERTVKAHVTNIYQKLGAQSRVELALAARGLLSSAAV